MTVDELRQALNAAPDDAEVFVVTGLGNEKVTPAEFGWTGENFLSIKIHGVSVSFGRNGGVRLELNEK
jgi:hypothetical protein